MEFLPKVLTAFGAVFFSLSTLQVAQAQVPVLDGQIAPGEYGSSYETGGQTWYMTWDDTNLYVATINASVSEASILYFDTNPLPIVNAGDANSGTTTGVTYDNTNGTLPFRADAVFSIKAASNSTDSGNNGGPTRRVARKFNTESGLWGDETPNVGSVELGPGGVREFSIPWSAISTTNARPAAFNWFGYIANGNGFVYAQAPRLSTSGTIGTNAYFLRYFTVLNTVAGSNNRAFGPNNIDSYSYSGSGLPENISGPITVYDFTLNSPNGLLTRIGEGSVWDIQGSLRVENGTLNIGASSAAIRVVGDLTFRDATAFSAGSAPVILTGTGNQTISGDTYNSLIIQGPGVKTITSNLTINESLVINSGTLATGPNTVQLGTTGRLSESSNGYLLGRVSSLTPIPLASEGNSHDFGNIGLTLTQGRTQGQGNILNTVSVLRVTGLPGTLRGGSELRRTISRRFSVNANLNNNAGNQAYNVSMDFRYRTDAFDELGGNNPSLLELYQSENASNFTGSYTGVSNVLYDRTVPNVLRTTGSLRLDGTFFSLADGVTPLPVELNSFTGNAENNAVRLTWATATELQNKGFDIEHRTDLSEWKKLGFVKGNGTSNQRHSYTYIDRAAAAGNNYYRLRQIDLDGKAVYSQPVTVQLGVVAFTLSPVPATDVLTLNGLGAGKHTTEIYNVRGQRVMSQEFSNEAATTLTVSMLPAGVYMVRVLSPDRSVRQARFIKQ
ncbi:T9SS type A sorting domain-containing protein [Hymenobacter qilianensis]|uniref:T9SS type A sorting domain-containing protein n=2 Tax=Hymenobacter qilianensis TaxID=1385715 RepID=A0A7H0GW63_9BACT|nr:T9SS type A sorting domain-containing protein [Hymenobacter qilianensis]QNP52529.1 T9SS type A sorting domain-containing protein [Hymenobacter qilianensis]